MLTADAYRDRRMVEARLFGLRVLFTACCAALAVAFWLPRRRVTVRPQPAGGLSLVLRGERFDRPADEVARLERMFGIGP